MIKLAVNFTDTKKRVSEIKNACNAAIEAAAENIREEAKSFAPVKTGKLRESIKTEKKDNYISVGSDVPYAFFVEYGTSRAVPAPFFQPATVMGAETLRENLKDRLK